MWPLVAASVVYLLVRGRKSRVFVSYDHSEDVAFRNILDAWNNNPRFRFEYERRSPVQAIRSSDEAVVKRALTPKLKASSHLLVIVGHQTWTSDFVKWEIERAQAADVNLKVAAIKLNGRFRLPDGLRKGRAAWAVGFSEENVIRVLREARAVQ